MALIEALWALLILSWIYWLITLWLVKEFFRAEGAPEVSFTPPVSILKPVRWQDQGAYENFQSFCHQDYPEYELLFGVEDAQDPAVPILERLQRDHPTRNIRLLKNPAAGPNRKVSLLQHLAAQARHEVFAVSDSDMRVTPDYLRRVVRPLAQEAVGLVTCLYRGADPRTFASMMEALHINFTFLPNVLAGRKALRMRFALGASMALRRQDLERIGGFAALREYLADDYMLGLRISQLGKKVRLSRYMMTNILGATGLRDQWDRELRRAVTNRAAQPLRSLGLLLTFSTPLALLLAWRTDYAPAPLAALALSMALRWTVALQVDAFLGDSAARRGLIWLPARDVLSALFWLLGIFARQVVWRGRRLTVLSDGRLISISPAPFDVTAQPRTTGRDQP